MKFPLNWMHGEAQCYWEGDDNCMLSFIVQEIAQSDKGTISL